MENDRNPEDGSQRVLDRRPLDVDVANRPTAFHLTKTLVAAFEQCPRRLWLAVHRPDLAEQGEGPDPRAAAGRMVGEAARGVVQGGVLVRTTSTDKALAITRDLVERGDVAIFEGAFRHEGVTVRIDVLEPRGAGWHLAEVKSSTGVKAHHPADLATQAWVARGAGLPLASASIRHIDRTFVLTQEGRYEGAFSDAEMLDEISPMVADRSALAADAFETLQSREPVRPTGAYCDDPHPCPFHAHCGAGAPPGPEWPVTVLPNGGGNRWLALGVTDLFDVDPSKLRSANHIRIHRATTTGDTFHDVAAARAAIGGWAHPRIWLDFETIAFALPRWVGTRPYEQVPFQFSAHVEAEDGALEHAEFLSLDGADPRRGCAEALARLPAEGAVIAYNASFEAGVIRRLAELFPDLRAALESLLARIVDLLPLTRACWYHRDQRGSWSIKAVLPTIGAGLAYDGLEVKDGGGAQEAYVEAIDPDTTPERRLALRHALSTYCALDTEAMIALARRLVSH